MAQVTLNEVAKIYPGNVKAVKNINLEVRDHEFMVLVGPSGCGKSTTLRMVAGLEEISEGECQIGDRIINDVPPKDRDIAMVFQNYALYPHMTVRDNMAFGLKLRKFPKAEIAKRVDDAARILGLEEYLDRRPKALSGGQRQRVAMGRAIVREPAVFLFDEPLSNLDAKMRVEMRKEILQLHKRIDTTMLYVTHDQIEAMTLGDRITVMRDGIIEQVGEPEEVFDYPATLFVARFIGTPPMNLFEGTLEKDGDTLRFNGGAGTQAVLPAEMTEKLSDLAGKKVHLGLRPRAFVLKGTETSHDSSIAFKATVDLTEMLGEEVLVHLVSGEHRFITSINPHHRHLLDGGEVEICPIMERAHIFDGETELNRTMPNEIREKNPVGSMARGKQ
ncbi:MAG: ABC transporter ATP-binding protein [Planctomycetota bacterium]|jgi:multiple sugar transport system ATP-binding protein